MDAHTRQQAWEEVASLIYEAGWKGKQAASCCRWRTAVHASAAYEHAIQAGRVANRALDLLDQLRGE